MNWFKKSLPAHLVSQRNQSESTMPSSGESTSNICTGTSSNTDMSKSLCSLDEQNIEVLDPEEFFHDPDHVRHYKEEAVFLQIMAEWEIVDNPARLGDNYFSADFEDELLQRRIQGNHQETITPSIAELSAVSCMGEQMAVAGASAAARCGRKRKLYELLFVDNIQTGIALPVVNTMPKMVAVPAMPKKGKYSHCIDLKYEEDESKETQLYHEQQAVNITTKCCGGKQQVRGNYKNNQLHAQGCPSEQVQRKDCRINRKQLKTEALSSSENGAMHSSMNETDLKAANTKPQGSSIPTSTQLHGISELNVCDHFDIRQFFRLDDNGNILLNMTHIVEFKGYGYAIAQNKRHYRRYRRGCACADEDYCRQRGCCAILRRVLLRLWLMLRGHPRNKTNLYGSGPGDSLRAYTLQLAQDQSSTFARNIENFISCTKESREAAPQVVMRNMRQFMNGMKNYLVKHGEGKFHQEVETARSQLKSDEFLNLDAILETVMHQLVVLPLREHIYGMFVDYYTRSEDIQLLAQNVKYACGRDSLDFGIRPSVAPPSPTSLHAISNLLLRLQEAELPLDKLDIFLCVISTIFDATGCPRGQQLGADDFLPVLVYVVAKCGFVGAEIEAEFMWGLLQPTLLNGEPGYYLTALCSAVHVLKNFMVSESESGSGSLDWRSSQCMPACSSVLRVIIPDECNGSLQTRTLPVRLHTTTREVCRIIAHKARITNPQDYALFKLVDGEETLLADTECPQDVRFATKGKHCMLAYKRIDAKIAWPTTTTTSPSVAPAPAAAVNIGNAVGGGGGNS